MSSKTHHFRIGLFVLIGAFLFIGALFAMGLRSYFGQFDIYETAISGKVDNLSPGALVKLRGVTIGKVTSIDFAGSEYPEYKQQSIIIHFEVPKNTVWAADGGNVQQLLDTEIAHGLRARVQGQGFLGASIVALEYVDPTLYPVEPIAWTPKHYYIPSAPSQFNRVFSSLEKTLRRTEDIDLTDLLSRAQLLITGANRLVGNVNDVDFKQIGTNADSLIVEFRETNRRLQGALAGADIPAIGRETIDLENKLSADAAQLQHVLSGLDMGELNGALGNVRNATDELIVLLHKIEQRPSSVIFSKPPEPVSELEKPPKK
jgi:ABC-type transporter Mla subunit MlaD